MHIRIQTGKNPSSEVILMLECLQAGPGLNTDVVILSITTITYLNIISIYLFVNVSRSVHKVFKYSEKRLYISICKRLQNKKWDCSPLSKPLNFWQFPACFDHKNLYSAYSHVDFWTL